MTEARIIPIDGSGEDRPLKSVKAVGSDKPAKPVKRKRPAAAAKSAEPAKATQPRKRPKAKRVPPKPKRAPSERTTASDSADAPVVGGVDGSAASGARTAAGGAGAASERSLDDKVASVLAFLRRRITGDFEVDDFGYDAELTDKVLLAWLRPLYQHWFRVEIRGIENVPADGGALIVANHSGTIAIDSVMTQLALLDHHPQQRALRMLGADLVFSMPVVSEFARKSGATVACNEDAERLLGRGEVVGVWPEGFKGVGKPFSERYKLQRFGRGGFVAAALRAKVPIIPVSIVGAEEIYPIIGNLKTLARLLGVPYVPITPTFPWLGPLGLVPLPSKWLIEFGEPIHTDHYDDGAAEDPMLVFNLTDQVRETIQHTLYRLLMQRRSVFF